MIEDRDVFVHDRALCESDRVGAGTRIWAFAHVMAGAEIGRECKIGGGAFVEAGARIGDRVTLKNGVSVWDRVVLEDEVFVGPAAVFTNDLRPRVGIPTPPEEFLATRICRGATIGANATIVCGVKVGAFAFVAAGGVVVDDVSAHALVAGNPARRIGWACACGATLQDDLRCSCGRRYRLIDEDRGLASLG